MFYFKLAWRNIRQNKATYGPYLAALTFLVILNLLVQTIVGNKGIQTMPKAEIVYQVFTFGNSIIAIFSVIFAFYINSFIIKRRKKELGLYNVLGMDKKALSLMLLIESGLTCFLTYLAGLASGLVIGKFLFLVLKKLTGLGSDFVFQFNGKMLVSVLTLYLLIHLLLLIYNIFHLLRTNPIELLHGSSTGEKTPKAHWLLAVIGVGLLGSGYYISATIQSPISAIETFLLAIILVILGTYLLMITTSVAVLKFLQKRKNFYYQPKAFVNISGMLYRMKQNGAGLASICILSTMVLVTVISTAGLYFGSEEAIQNMYPYDVSVKTHVLNEDLAGEVEQLIEENQLEVTEQLFFPVLNAPLMIQQGENFTLTQRGNFSANDIMAEISIISLSDYQIMTGDNQTLAADECLLLDVLGEYSGKTLNIGGQNFKVKGKIAELPWVKQSVSILNNFVLVVRDEAILSDLNEKLNQTAVAEAYVLYGSSFMANVSGKHANRIAFSESLETWLTTQNSEVIPEALPYDDLEYVIGSTVDAEREAVTTLNGGFLFLGLIFGLSFTVAMALIIYYKQISEGYEDARRFEIMQKVGMSHKEVKSTIHNQILMVFLFPIGLATLHLLFALPAIRKILVLFGLMNQTLITVVSTITVVGFTLLYLAVYLLTSKVYYRMVERKN
ncbi:putative ABC transport system permease protein [Enterococcus sp. PF1-24]|uniref:ABC transporter permease n=1 Tax=unclassified Enterococcus TaxID=2608891 RepID=UPI002476A9BD|nr:MULTISPECIES: ABC transporter permease [unclassified Enterococcus]MDH6363942.1 putative ABC transport system permease protein [Enterococcus sp. PFB1-1]MDH6401043.1 putative ABC transport system permease protein [Enterococcus sp. PF1-24]